MKKPNTTLSRLAIVITVFLVLVIVVLVTLFLLQYFSSEKNVSHRFDSKTSRSYYRPTNNVAGYMIGVGRADCTSPVAEIPFMGYAKADQIGAGIISRLFCRAFIIAEPNDWSKRVLYVTAEIGMMSQRIRLEVMKQLKERYGDVYQHDNVILSAVHTHSGPGGYYQYTLYMISAKGFIKPSLNAIVNGILESVEMAHQNMTKGHVFINKGLVENSQINRSPFSYLRNPESERLRYSSNTDKEMVVLKMVADSGKDIGLFMWFPVHPVSMNNTNRLTCSDNVGYAAYLLEEEKNVGYLPGKGPYVAGFASSNLGDVSPNTKGPHCINTGESCENFNNYCPIGGPTMCMASGPGRDMFESTKIIGRNIYLKAKELSMKASEEISGPIRSRHTWVDMANFTVQLNATHLVKTCKAAMGYSFAAGTMDGPGILNFTQGTTEGNEFYDAIRDALLTNPSNETKKCQHPKPILLPTGELSIPYPWQPHVIDVQIATIGPVAIIALPGEFTTMAGRRVREAVKSEFESQGRPGMNIILSGLSNIYTHYITTYEEYQAQRYEGASTLYGPHTLSAYIQSFRALAKAIAKGTVLDLPELPEPKEFNISLNLLPLVIDAKPLGKKFGDVIQDARSKYRVGEVVDVHFVGANPRNSAAHMTSFTFLTVEKFDNTSRSWHVVHEDASWDTRFMWQKGNLGQSTSQLQWHIQNNTEPGTYRLQYFGHSREWLNSIKAFNGSSSTFEVSN